MLNIPFFTMQTIFILSSASPLLVTARLHRTCVCHHRRPVIFRSIECTKHLSDVDSRRKRKIHQFLRAKQQNRNATMTDQIYSCRQRRWCLSPFFFVCFIFISFSFLSMLDLHYVFRRLCAPSGVETSKCSDSLRSHEILNRIWYFPLISSLSCFAYSYSIYHFILSTDKMKWQTSNQKARERKNNSGRLNQWVEPGLETQQTPLTHKRTQTHKKRDMRQSKPEVIWCQSKHGNYIMF